MTGAADVTARSDASVAAAALLLAHTPPRLLLCRACLFQCALRLTTSAPQPPPAATQDLRDSYDRAERDALAYLAVPGIYDATDVIGHELVFVAAAHR